MLLILITLYKYKGTTRGMHYQVGKFKETKVIDVLRVM